MLTLTYTVGGVTQDISKYVDWKSVSIKESLNVPSQLNFNAYNYDPQFPKLYQRAYVTVYSSRFERSLFTGFISAQPNAVFQAIEPPGVHLFQYQIICTSDEYLINNKAVPFIPAFVCQTQGQVLAAIANQLCPNFFDTSMVGSGDIEPYFNYDPRQSWCELAKTFGDGSRYRYHVRDKKIWYQPYGDGALGVAYDESKSDTTFDPFGLSTQVLAVPTVNDITVIGDAEAGNSREDYFIGDGFTGNFPLRHKVYEGASQLLLQDNWNEGNFNTQQWYVNDPGDQFNLSTGGGTAIGALNIVSSFEQPLGQSYIQLNNGLELAGGIDLEHGEFGWNDVSLGIVGGLYRDTTFAPSACLGGFFISSTGGVVTSASGAAGVAMQAVWDGEPVGPPVVSEVNHTYVLQTVLTAPKYVRYNRFYRSIGGNVYGGVETQVSGHVTFIVQDYDVAQATGFYYQPNITKSSVSAVELPAFAVYGLINNQQLNCTIDYTTLALMPLGALSAYEGPSGLMFPSGLILPMLPPGSGGYIGAVNPWPASGLVLPALIEPWQGNGVSSIWPAPAVRNNYPTQEVLGNGFELQAAQITQGNAVDTLAFYAQTLPAAGTPVRFQSWESQAAISRLQASASIVSEQYVVGDDGIRSAIVSNLSPLPRTSEDCDHAAQAYLDDRTGVFYNGSYQCSSYHFNNLTADEQFWPTCGRYLYINSPLRGIDREWMLVKSVGITVLDAVGNNQRTFVGGDVGEVLQFQIGFGADLHLEKLLPNLTDIKPPDILSNYDKATPPNPIYGYEADNAYLPDINSIMVYPILDETARVTIYDPFPAGAAIELREDDANWGNVSAGDYIATKVEANFDLRRSQFEQIWYMRFVNYSKGTYSRRSKVVRLYYPLKPLQPTLVTANTNFIQFDFNGDIRNVYGFELRSGDNETILVQKPVVSYGDLDIDLTQTANTFPFTQNRTFYAYFFNHQWSYSEAVEVQLPAPAPPILEEGYRDGQAIGILTTVPPANRLDVISQRLQMATDPAFVTGILVDLSVNPALGGTPKGAILSAQLPAYVPPQLPPKQVFATAVSSNDLGDGNNSAEVYGASDVDTSGGAIYISSVPLFSSAGWQLIWSGFGTGIAEVGTQLLYSLNWANSTNVSGELVISDGLGNSAGGIFGLGGGFSTGGILPFGNNQLLDITGWDLSTLSVSLELYDFSGGVFSPRAEITLAGLSVLVPASIITGSVLSQLANAADTFDSPYVPSLYARSYFVDYISSGAWSNRIYIPSGNLIASDYLAAQGSVPPVFTQGTNETVVYRPTVADILWGTVTNGANAYDDDPASYATLVDSTVVYSGFSNQSVGLNPSSLVLTIISAPWDDNHNDPEELQYSLDGGVTWQTIYDVSPAPTTPVTRTDTVNLDILQNITKVQVKIGTPSGHTAENYLYDINITALYEGAGSLITYTSSPNLIQVITQPFSILYPNDTTWTVPSFQGVFGLTKDTKETLQESSGYFFYASLPSAAYANPTVNVDGPYANASQSALAFTYSDGNVPLAAGALEFYAAASGSSGSIYPRNVPTGNIQLSAAYGAGDYVSYTPNSSGVLFDVEFNIDGVISMVCDMPYYNLVSGAYVLDGSVAVTSEFTLWYQSGLDDVYAFVRSSFAGGPPSSLSVFESEWEPGPIIYGLAGPEGAYRFVNNSTFSRVSEAIVVDASGNITIVYPYPTATSLYAGGTAGGADAGRSGGWG